MPRLKRNKNTTATAILPLIIAFVLASHAHSQNDISDDSSIIPDSVVTLETQRGRRKVQNYFGSRCVTYEYDRDTLLSCSSYINGILDGLCLDYYPNGNVRCLKTFETGITKGLYLQYYPNGFIEAMGSIDGRREKIAIEEITVDSETGEQIVRTIKSPNWDRIGIWFFYSRDGKLERTEYYD